MRLSTSASAGPFLLVELPSVPEDADYAGNQAQDDDPVQDTEDERTDKLTGQHVHLLGKE